MAGKGYWCGDGKIHAFDMRNGTEVWAVTGSFDFGAIENGQAELVSTSTKNLVKYDAFSGKILANISGIIGSEYRNFDISTVDNVGGYILDLQKTGNATFLVKWSYMGSDTNFTNRIAWNVTWPFEGPESTNVRGATIELNAGVASWITYPVYGESGAINYTDGQLLWKKELYGIQARNAHGVYDGKIYFPSDDRTVIALDLKTGKQVWKSEQLEYPWGGDFAYSHASAYGNIYKLTYAGVYALNATDGKIQWHFTSGDSGTETPYGTWPFYDNVIGADGVLFATTTEHTPTTPTIEDSICLP
jgi:outer membrane protein assembly factor BamB